MNLIKRTVLSRSRFSRYHLLAFILVFAAIGAYILLSSKAASNIQVWMSPSGNDSTCIRGDSSKPCLTFSKAYSLAQCGDGVSIAAGTYASESMTSAPKSCTSSTPVDYSAAGAVSMSGDLTINGPSYITIENINFGLHRWIVWNLNQSATSCGSSYITFKNVTANEFTSTGYVCNLSVIGGAYVGTDNDSAIGPNGNGGNGLDPPSAHTVLIDGVHFGTTESAGYRGHLETLHIWGNDLSAGEANNITIQNSVFDPCPIDNGSGSTTGCTNLGSGTDGLTIQNNFFNSGTNPAFDVGYNEKNVLIQYNSSPGSMGTGNVEANCPLGAHQCGPWTIRGNYMTAGYGTCMQHTSGGGPNGSGTDVVTYSYNAWKSDGGGGTTTCGPTDVFVASLDFISTTQGSMNLHLNGPSATAIGRGDSANCPATDIDGDSRPQGGSCDAGADEYVQTANVWVTANGNDTVCTRGDPSKPCATFNKAYQIAQPGDRVEIASGTYPSQTINWDSTKTSVNCDGWVAQQGNVTPITSGCITFTPASGATVAFTGSIAIFGNDVRLLNLNLGSGPGGHGVGVNDGGCDAGSNNRPSYIILDGIQAYFFGIDASSHVALLNSTINRNDTGGPLGQLLGCDPDGSGPIANSVSDHVRLQNDVFENVLENAGHHDTCIHSTDAGTSPQTGVQPLTYLVVSHSRFQNCAEQDMEIQSDDPNPDHDFLFENNYLAAPCSEQPANVTQPGGSMCGPIDTLTVECSPVNFTALSYNIDIRFNTFDGGNVDVDTTTGGTNRCSGLTSFRIYGNIIGAFTSDFSCSARANAGISFKYNVWYSGVNCGDASNILVASEPTIDPSVRGGAVGATTYNARLSSCSVAAADFIPPNALTSPFGYPLNDYAGTNRPQGTNYDAGAYEACPSSGSTPGDLNSDFHVNITDLSIMLSHYGQAATASQGDCDGDGSVTVVDLSILLSHYGI